MSTTPKVSICIPSYNHARFLPAALDSALAQTYRDFEIIVVDDGSTDDSLQIAEGYAARYPSLVRVFTHPDHGNHGISATVNLCFRLARGTYHSGLPSDDALYPDKIERQVKYLEEHPEVGWVYSYGDFIDAEGRTLPEEGLFGSDITRDPNPLERLLLRNVIPGMTVLARRACIEEIGGDHDESLIHSDWEFWLRLLARCKAGFIDRPLVMYRVHSYNTSIGPPLEVHQQRTVAVLRSLRRKAREIGGAFESPRARALIEMQLAHFLFQLGETHEATRHLAATFETDPALRGDPEYFIAWLDAVNAAPEFRLWITERITPHVGKAFAKRLAAAEYIHVAHLRYEAHDLRGARQMALRYLAHAPFGDDQKSALYILGESLVGRRLMERTRHLARRGQAH